MPTFSISNRKMPKQHDLHRARLLGRLLYAKTSNRLTRP
jgi:hypothetical protein